jgi:uncharacterized Rmd1/YagE family protein
MSKYAEKQRRLAEDPDYGYTYEVKTKEEVAAEKVAANEAAQVDVEKIAAKIVAISSEITLAEAKITRYVATMKATAANIAKQKANVERYRAQLAAYQAKLQLRETATQNQ